MNGLYQERERQVKTLEFHLADNTGGPAADHVRMAEAQAARNAIEFVDSEIALCCQVISDIRSLVKKLAGSRPTPNKTLAMRHLEDSESRLMRELGDP